MWQRLSIILAYLTITLIIGIVFRKQASANKVEFFLAGRGVGRLLLFFTMAATNFSAFTIFGLSGAGYRIGYAFYPVMGFGTGFMALSFLLIGKPILSLSKERNYITPSDFIADRYGAPWLKRLFSIVMIVFTLPYIAIQAIASGKSLNALVGIPYLSGALLITAFIVLYVTLGGMRSIVWTDLIQALMMVGFTFVAFFIILRGSGGFVRTHDEVYGSFPALFSRPGQDGSMLFGIWFGYMFLWFFADPMFPQLFQRFIVAKDQKSLNTTVVLYPLITTFLFFLTVSIGVLGRHTFPDLAPAETDAVFPMLLQRYAGVFVSTLLITGSLAALMSTMDSQLLTLTSLITVDFVRIRKREVLKEKAVIIVLGVLGFLIAVKPPQTILDFISKTTFNGLAVLAPTVIAGLYWKKANRYAAAASIVAGEGLVLAFYFKVLSMPGILPIVPILVATSLVFVAVSLLIKAPGENTDIIFPIRAGSWPWVAIFGLLFILGNDFWAWNREPVRLLGVPLWVWYYVGLGIVLSIVYGVFVGKGENA
ncbi:MAG: sodium:solute symporter family protein [Spirochaetaceae bacterium]|nr:MAG: sodium:solute symporter family protein [Spirochaetaceae bacterium]